MFFLILFLIFKFINAINDRMSQSYIISAFKILIETKLWVIYNLKVNIIGNIA